MKTLLALFLLSTAAFAQTLTIPARTFNTPVTVGTQTVQITITIPAQTVTLPPITAALPTGLTYANNVLTVAGSISTPSISLTGGPAVPSCTSNLFLFQMVGTTLEPACYVAPALTVPPVTVTQAPPPAVNTFTITP